MIHELKTWPDPFEAVWMGSKKAEFRKDDRGFRVGDGLTLKEWVPESENYTGREIYACITDLRRGPQFGIPEGFVMLSVSDGTRLVIRPSLSRRS